MSELLKTRPNGQWELLSKNVNCSQSYAMDANGVQMSEKEFLKFSATGSGQWSICKGRDPMASRTTAIPGVSERGIEVRRASKKVPADKVVSHGYARVTSPEKHLETAKQIGRQELADTKSVKKPQLP